MKQHFAIALLFLACGNSFANESFDSTKAPTPPSVTLTLGSPSYSMDMFFNALILQPFANNSDYAAEALPFNYGDAQPAVSPSWVIPEISPGFHFGFDVGMNWIFHGAKSSLMMNWERYHSSNDSDSLTVDNVNNMVGPFFEIGPDASTYKTAQGSARFHFDEVNLDYGTFVNFGAQMETNWFTGIGFARLVQYRFSQFSNLAGTIVRTLNVPSKFIGAGPQLGLDFSYKVIKGFRFVGAAKGSLFVGNFSNSTTFSTTSNALVILGDQNPNIQTTQVDNKMGIVPGLESKLGFAYEFLSSCSRYFVKLEAGYQAQVYINAIRSIDLGSEVTLGSAGAVGSSTVGVYARTFQRTVSDFALAGPYAAIDFAF